MSTSYIIGIDEVGRGPVAGPLVVCACAIRKDISLLHFFPKGELKDSKKLSEKHRLHIAESLKEYFERKEVVYGIGEVAAERLDAIGLSKGIQEAIHKAMTSVHAQGVPEGSFIFLDGSLKVDEKYQQQTVIKGDEKILEIAIASIIAKVYRDTHMKEAAQLFPLYGFEDHVGYGTKKHYEAIKKHGLTPLHRRSFLKNIK